MAQTSVERLRNLYSIKVVTLGALAGLVGGLVFGLMMWMMGMLPLIGMLIGRKAPLSASSSTWGSALLSVRYMVSSLAAFH